MKPYKETLCPRKELLPFKEKVNELSKIKSQKKKERIKRIEFTIALYSIIILFGRYIT